MQKLMGLIALFLVLAAPAYAYRVYLQSEEIRDNVKLCFYNDGVIVTVALHELCPLSVEKP